MLKAVILAAGEGTRMKSKVPKVIHKVLEKPMVEYVVEAALEAGASEICVVVGHQKEAVMSGISYPVTFVYQESQLGTGHAVMQAETFIGDTGQTLILFGDTPMITGETLKSLIAEHNHSHNTVTVLSAKIEDPTGYGRIIRDENQEFLKSVEDKDASPIEKQSKEINSGMYLFDSKALVEALGKLSTNNAQSEYYLPDTLMTIMGQGLKVDALVCKDYEEILGINNKVQLAEAGRIIQKRINEQHMLNGVTIIDPSHTYIGKEVVIGVDTTIYPGVIINGDTVIGTECNIGPNTNIQSCHIGNNTSVNHSTVLESTVGDHTTIGPYAYIRPNCTIKNHIKIGDFVEIKNAVIEDYTKVSHLTYIGDADVGEHVNFGCGTVVVNYDGVHKHRTTIKDHAFIGCNTNLVSPVIIEENAYTAAGSTITEEVPAYALGIARAKQMNIEGWVKRKR